MALTRVFRWKEGGTLRFLFWSVASLLLFVDTHSQFGTQLRIPDFARQLPHSLEYFVVSINIPTMFLSRQMLTRLRRSLRRALEVSSRLLSSVLR